MKNINKNKIKDIVIAITYKCNSRCKMCNIWQKKDHSNELTKKSFYNLPKNLRSINISGGEPFLREDLVEILKIIKTQCPKAKIIISSNGFATNLILNKVTKIVKFIPNIGIAFSIDGIKDKHEEVRNIPNGYSKILKTIEALKNIGVSNLKIGFTLGDYNTKELRKVYRLSKELDMEFSLAVVHSSDHYFSTKNFIRNKNEIINELDWLIKKELSSLNPKKWLRAYFTHGLKYLLNTGKRILPDYSGELNLFINPTGDIYANDIASNIIGKLNEKEFTAHKNNKIAPNWMICTARQSIKKHWIKVGYFILSNKLMFWKLRK